MTNTEQKGMEPVVEKNADKKKMFLQALFNNAGFIKRACDAVGISRETYYRWIDKNGRYYDEEFAKEVKGVFSDFESLAESQLIRNIQEGKEVSLIFYLKNRNPEKWNDRRILKHETDGFVVKFVDNNEDAGNKGNESAETNNGDGVVQEDNMPRGGE